MSEAEAILRKLAAAIGEIEVLGDGQQLIDVGWILLDFNEAELALWRAAVSETTKDGNPSG